MLITSTKLLGTPVLSVQTSGAIAQIDSAIIDPDNLKIIAFKLSGPAVTSQANLLDVKSIREYSHLGLIIDSEDELINSNDVIKIKDVLDLNFNLLGLKVETRKGSKLGHITGYTFNSDDFVIQQIIVKRPLVKSFVDPELTIHRREIVEITDYKVVVKDEEKVLKARANKEDFVPNFVNPFRTDPTFAASETEEKPD